MLGIDSWAPLEVYKYGLGYCHRRWERLGFQQKCIFAKIRNSFDEISRIFIFLKKFFSRNRCENCSHFYSLAKFCAFAHMEIRLYFMVLPSYPPRLKTKLVENIYCLDNRKRGYSWTCLHQKVLSFLDVYTLQRILLHLDVPTPQGPHLHLDFSGHKESVLLLAVSTACRCLSCSWTCLTLDMSAS